MTPARWQALEQALALVCVTAGVALIYVPAALIVFGMGLYASTVLDRRT
jgi:hypothetical protein